MLEAQVSYTGPKSQVYKLQTSSLTKSSPPVSKRLTIFVTRLLTFGTDTVNKRVYKFANLLDNSLLIALTSLQLFGNRLDKSATLWQPPWPSLQFLATTLTSLQHFGNYLVRSVTLWQPPLTSLQLSVNSLTSPQLPVNNQAKATICLELLCQPPWEL